ncbi:MAG: ACT domain-containing protein [Ruminococcus sp.]|nr:ACT domain-containing protein [Ruminococcus sp.]MDD6708753.1 ACT domain-containing protein [Ruminococcus sp.]
MKAVITVVGKDTVGILAKVSTVCSEYDANIVEVSQSVLQNMFAMIMLVELGKKNFGELSSTLEKLGDENNLKIHSMHEDIFNSMHKI